MMQSRTIRTLSPHFLIAHPPVYAVIILIFAADVPRNVCLVRTRLVRVNRISFLSRVPSYDVGTGSWTRSGIRRRRYQYERVAGNVNVLMIVFGVVGQARHEAESLQNRFLEEKKSLRVRILSEFCAFKLYRYHRCVRR